MQIYISIITFLGAIIIAQSATITIDLRPEHVNEQLHHQEVAPKDPQKDVVQKPIEAPHHHQQQPPKKQNPQVGDGPVKEVHPDHHQIVEELAPLHHPKDPVHPVEQKKEERPHHVEHRPEGHQSVPHNTEQTHVVPQQQQGHHQNVGNQEGVQHKGRKAATSC